MEIMFWVVLYVISVVLNYVFGLSMAATNRTWDIVEIRDVLIIMCVSLFGPLASWLVVPLWLLCDLLEVFTPNKPILRWWITPDEQRAAWIAAERE